MKVAHLALISALAFFPVVAQADLAQLTVTVKGIDPASGSLEVSVFNSAETFMKTPLIQQSQPVGDQTQIAFTFAGLLEGEYAVVVVHDENDNKTLDSGFLGFGGERYGYSSDVRPWFGWPSFASARFKVALEDVAIEIDLN